MKKNLLALALILNLAISINAQISYEQRIEFESKNGYTDEKITEFGDIGFVLSSKSTKAESGQLEWKFEQYNTDLELVNSKKIMLQKNLKTMKSIQNEGYIHTFLKNKKDFTLISVDAESLAIKKITGTLGKLDAIKDMAVLGDYAYIKVEKEKKVKSAFTNTSKRLSRIYSINWKTGALKLIPTSVEGVDSKKTEFTEFQVLKEKNEAYIYAKMINKKKRMDMYVVQLNDRGGKESMFNLTKKINKTLIDISCSKLDDGRAVYTGTYSSKSSKTSQGIFFIQADKGKVEFAQYYNFLDLKNFLSYLPERAQKRIEKKKDRKQNRGVEMEMNYRIACHQMIEVEDGYLFLGESYYPTYRTETYTTYTNGVASTSTRTVFDGYQYTHAILSKFDKEGTLVWDQVFEMWSAYKPFTVKKFISISQQDQEAIKLIFSSRNKINVMSFDYDGNIITDSKSEEIQTNFEGDKTKRSFSNINFWYDNYFIAYGNQKIKNRDNEPDTKRVRNVYFVNKIKFE